MLLGRHGVLNKARHHWRLHPARHPRGGDLRGASVARMERSAMRVFALDRPPPRISLRSSGLRFQLVIAGPPRSGVTRQSIRQRRACGPPPQPSPASGGGSAASQASLCSLRSACDAGGGIDRNSAWTPGSSPAVMAMKLPRSYCRLLALAVIRPHQRAAADRRPSSHHAKRWGPSHSHSAR